MSERVKRNSGVMTRLKLVVSHVNRGFSFIIAPHGTGTTVTFNMPGRLATLILIAVVAFVAGLAFVGVTYTRLAFLAVETTRLRTENQVLRSENQKIREIERELVGIDNVRRRIEAWAGIVPDRGEPATPPPEPVLTASFWPRRYTYAIMKPYYVMHATYPHGMMRPAAGWISRRFTGDVAEPPQHPGIDIAAATGTPVRNALDGVVKSAGWDEVYGNVIVIAHNDSISTVYGHNEKILVKEGAYVTKGQVIATVGSTGRSTAPHLHFEVLKYDDPIDPELYIDFSRN